jgi:hypothetical protein
MINGLRRGDRVKLTDRYANVLMNDDRGPKSRGVDWRARRGTVWRLNANDVYIIWDGRTSWDLLPHKAVEKAVEMQTESAA